jgi:hypothetical protein
LDEFADKNLLSIKCVIEATIQYELKNMELAELVSPVQLNLVSCVIALNESIFVFKLFQESVAREEKQSSLTRYVQPYANIQLSCLYMNMSNWPSATHYLNKARSFKDYDLEDRLQIQMRTIQRRIDYKTSLNH